MLLLKLDKMADKNRILNEETAAYLDAFFQKCIDSRDLQYIGPIERIISTHGENSKMMPVTVRAFKALYFLDGDKHYFIQAVEHYKEHPMVAGLSLQALAGDFDDPATRKAINSIDLKNVIPNSSLEEGLKDVSAIKEISDKCNSIQNLNDRIDYTLEVICNYRGLYLALPRWANNYLIKLSEQYPKEVAARIENYKNSEKSGISDSETRTMLRAIIANKAKNVQNEVSRVEVDQTAKKPTMPTSMVSEQRPNKFDFPFWVYCILLTGLGGAVGLFLLLRKK